MSRWFITYGLAEVAPNLLMGALPGDAADVRKLSGLGVTRVLNLVDDSEYERGSRSKVETALERAGIAEHRVSTADYGALDDGALDEATTTIGEWLDEGEVVYVHCRAGWQRSAAVAAATLALRQGIDIEQALRLVNDRKPTAVPLAHQRQDLHRWWSLRRAQL